MMHEQNHSQSTVKTDSSGKPYRNLPGDMDEPKRVKLREEVVEEIANPMREHALLNFYPSVDQMNEAIKRGEFSRFLKVQNTVGFHVIMTISPADNEKDAPFWHCSISIISTASGKAKTLNLWTKREMLNIRNLLPEFFGTCGLKNTQGFMRTKTALHCYRNLTPEEIQIITANS